MTMSARLRLMRFDKPAGIYLLAAPVLWALWTASSGTPPFMLLFFFSLGVVLMRAAGCVINDLADRNIDKHVERTKERPLTSGEISLTQAVILALVLLLAAASLLLFLPANCIYYAIAALIITMIYPLCKRFIYLPQAVLGIAFSMSIPMAYNALGRSIDASFVLLFMINCLWVIAYDTIYAMVDKKDDLIVGVKSTAIYFANYDRFVIGLFQVSFHGFWLFYAEINHLSKLFYLFWGLAAVQLLYQQYLIFTRDPKRCLQAFLSNAYYGLLMVLALAFGY